MKKRNTKKEEQPNFIVSCYGLKPVQSSDDVENNLEKYLAGHFTLLERSQIFLTLHETKEEYYDRLHDGFGENGFDLDSFMEIYAKPRSFSKWRKNVKRWIDPHGFPDLTAEVLDTYFQYHMIDDPDNRDEMAEGKWNCDIIPLLQN